MYDFKNFNFTNGQDNPTPTEVVSTTEVVKESASITWMIEGESDDTKWEAIKAQAKCFLELGKNKAQPQKLYFFLRDDGNGEEFPDPVMKTLKKEARVCGSHAVASCCILTGGETKTTGLFPARSPQTTAQRAQIPQPSELISDQDFIRIKITLTIYSCKGTQDSTPVEEVAIHSLTKDLGTLYSDGNGEGFFPDLELESKNGIRLKTHKFIVAARSPPLKTRLEELEKETGNEKVAVLKMPELNSQPLRAILHWMYKGELSPLGGLGMADVIKGARTLQLTPLLRICDKKLISLCNRANMFELYQVAKDNAFPNATKDIAQFIKV
ncbi:TD and POZ domain-containing protein 1 [Orchesella cincta]|uniref:TD and POZ domain-containing protein 1 n=1 Tax=Orchesella cincta TaxID=48709 RepID=A0A1D2MFT4_ORCCI|nr:TD and POZ domain-containing protein 1 [Orchesella cincta]